MIDEDTIMYDPEWIEVPPNYYESTLINWIEDCDADQ